MNKFTQPKKSKTVTKASRQQPAEINVAALEMKKARGFLKGIDTTIEREPDREF